ncbi:hypothetical protein D3C76_693340 [compost metagenome]
MSTTRKEYSSETGIDHWCRAGRPDQRIGPCPLRNSLPDLRGRRLAVTGYEGRDRTDAHARSLPPLRRGGESAVALGPRRRNKRDRTRVQRRSVFHSHRHAQGRDAFSLRHQHSAASPRTDPVDAPRRGVRPAVEAAAPTGVLRADGRWRGGDIRYAQWSAAIRG